MSKSVWKKETKLSEFNEKKDEIKTDVLIVGGGICGILCAYFLEKNNIDYVLAEGGRIADGVTKNTTAKITSQHSLIYQKLIKSAGSEKARMYLEANERALMNYRQICKELDCDFEEKPAVTYSLSDRKKIEDEIKAVASLGYKAHFREKLNLPFDTAGGIVFENQAQFNPLKFIDKISKGLNIYENTFIKSVDENNAFFDGGRIIFNKMIVATHFPFINKHGSYFLKMYQSRSYVIAVENGDDVGGMYIDEAENGMSFRNYKNLLFIGGGGHQTGKNGGNYNEIRDFIKKYYPNSIEKFSWAAQDCMSLDSIPYIGKYSKRTPNLYVASGFNKWGMTSSMAAAEILCDLIMERKNQYAEVFSPERSILKPQLFLNGINTAVNFFTPTAKRCPHLGCALKWNKAEHSWDCPCHGSRFDKNGKLIDNPATGDAKIN